MCGYFANLYESPAVIDLFNQLNIPLPYPRGQQYTLRICDGLVTATEVGYEVRQAMWWYAMKWDNGKLAPDTDITSFNARNLHSRMWRKPIDERRAVVFATEIGETQRKNHYLMKAKKPLAIAAVYQDYHTSEGPVRSFALITRPATARFAQYHEKAMPLFLPLNKHVIEAWLDPARNADDPLIRSLLENPSITTEMEVTPVKTFKRAEPVGQSQTLEADD